MGADSKSLSRALLRLSRDMRARGAARQTLSASLTSLFASRSVRDAEETWASRLVRGVQERQGGQLDWDAAQALCVPAEHMAAGGTSRRARQNRTSQARTDNGSDAIAKPRRRRWASWRSAASWDFPTLNSSFPFTIPSIPVNVFLFAHAGGHSSIPSGVMMPAGLGTSARKFHSMSLTRQPGVPFDGSDDGEPPFTDAAALAAQMLQADAAARAVLSQHGRKKAAGTRRADGAGGSLRSRTPKNYMFAHAATGIPKHETRIPLPKKTAAGADADEELATSAGEDA
ncbi:hypothetical protein IWW50_006866, partial [Coemansia erecta]